VTVTVDDSFAFFKQTQRAGAFRAVCIFENAACTEARGTSAFRCEAEAIIGGYLEDDALRHDYLMTVQ